MICFRSHHSKSDCTATFSQHRLGVWLLRGQSLPPTQPLAQPFRLACSPRVLIGIGSVRHQTCPTSSSPYASVLGREQLFLRAQQPKPSVQYQYQCPKYSATETINSIKRGSKEEADTVSVLKENMLEKQTSKQDLTLTITDRVEGLCRHKMTVLLESRKMSATSDLGYIPDCF